MMMPLIRRGLCAALAAIALAPAGATTLTVCIGDRDYPPVFFLHHDGQAQWLVRKAVERQGDKVSFVAVPWRRCLHGVSSGIYDAALPVIANRDFASHYAFPMRKGAADPAQRVATISHLVVRRIGSASEWDGSKFSHLDTQVFYPAGIVVVAEALARLGVASDDAAAGEEQTLLKLLSRGGDLAVIHAGAVDLLDRAPFKGRIEVLPQPLVTASAHLVFNLGFHAHHLAYAEAVWHEIERLRTTDEWITIAPTLAH